MSVENFDLTSLGVSLSFCGVHVRLNLPGEAISGEVLELESPPMLSFLRFSVTSCLVSVVVEVRLTGRLTIGTMVSGMLSKRC